MKTSSLSNVKRLLCVNDNYLFLVIHLCAIACAARVLFSILYPPLADGNETPADNTSVLSADLLKIKSAFFWYATIPFLYVILKRVRSAAVGLTVSFLAAVPGFFAGEWMGWAGSGYPETIFLASVALYLYPLLDRAEHWRAVKWVFGLLLGALFWVNALSLFVIFPMVVHYAYHHRCL